MYCAWTFFSPAVVFQATVHDQASIATTQARQIQCTDEHSVCAHWAYCTEGKTIPPSAVSLGPSPAKAAEYQLTLLPLAIPEELKVDANDELPQPRIYVYPLS